VEALKSSLVPAGLTPPLDDLVSRAEAAFIDGAKECGSLRHYRAWLEECLAGDEGTE